MSNQSDAPKVWRPGIEVCAQLLRTAFPDLVLNAISVLGEGWDSVAFLVNSDLVFRLPKREPVARMLERERNLLELIADRLPASVPRCTLIARNLPGFPPSLGGYPRIPGAPLSLTGVQQASRHQLAQDIAQFLLALHGIDLSAIPLNVIAPKPLDSWWEDWWELYESARPGIEQSCPAPFAQVIRDRWERAFADARTASFSPALIHGDLASEHLLIDNRGRLSGVIDFGDAGSGDPALDLAGLPDDLAEPVIRRYAVHPLQQLQLDGRRRFYQLTVPFHAIRAGHDWNRPDLVKAGLAGLRDRFKDSA